MQIKWITRPNLPQLGIDLTEFHNAGAFQFAGRTSEGRPIWAKYRSGWLKVAFESPDEIILAANIGPFSHGAMLPEQVCDLTGMTIKGRAPTISTERLAAARKEEPFLDWSGATMYWSAPLKVSEAGGKALESAVNKVKPDHDVRIYLGAQSPSARIIEQPDYFDRPTYLPSAMEGWLHVSVATADIAGRRFLENLFSEHLFNRIDIVDLATQVITHTHEAPVCYSRDLIDWCAAGPDRYLIAIRNSNAGQRMTGARPAHDLETCNSL